MSKIDTFFATRIYRGALTELSGELDVTELENSCYSIAQDDEAGQAWCEEHDYIGYTSYASLNDLDWRFPIFKDLILVLDKHAEAFAKDLEFDLDGKSLKLDSIWINILPEGGIHTAHIHPHSVISGTCYVKMPKDTSAIKFEDPRLAMMMAAPTRKETARPEMKNFIYFKPQAGEILLWESWLRHEVPMNMSEDERISVSFNFSWGRV